MNNRKEEADQTRRHPSHQDSNPCPICLAPLVQESYLDACFRILNDVFDVLRFWKSRKYLQSNMWLLNWLKRELQALMQEEDVDIVVHHIHGLIGSFWRRIEETRGLKKHAEAMRDSFKIAVSEAAKPFLLARTDRFVNELELFLASGLNIEAYDAVYMQRLGWNTSGSSLGSSSCSGETTSNNPLEQVVPYLYIFDVDSDNDE